MWQHVRDGIDRWSMRRHVPVDRGAFQVCTSHLGGEELWSCLDFELASASYASRHPEVAVVAHAGDRRRAEAGVAVPAAAPGRAQPTARPSAPARPRPQVQAGHEEHNQAA